MRRKGKKKGRSSEVGSTRCRGGERKKRKTYVHLTRTGKIVSKNKAKLTYLRTSTCSKSSKCSSIAKSLRAPSSTAMKIGLTELRKN